MEVKVVDVTLGDNGGDGDITTRTKTLIKKKFSTKYFFIHFTFLTGVNDIGDTFR